MNKVIAFGVIFSIALSSQAGWLKWQVGTEIGDDLSAVEDYEAEVGAWTTATFYQYKTDAEGKVTDKSSLASLPNLGDGEAGPNVVNLGNSAETAGYSYYVELTNSKGVVGYSSSVTYTSLADIVVPEEPLSTDVPTMTAWHGGTYKAAPEPTSAMLMLIGVAGLALRRKQRKA